MSKISTLGRPTLATFVLEIQKLEHERDEGKVLDRMTALLRNWQSERLARTLRNPL
jgi:hypothetical protein